MIDSAGSSGAVCRFADFLDRLVGPKVLLPLCIVEGFAQHQHDEAFAGRRRGQTATGTSTNTGSLVGSGIGSPYSRTTSRWPSIASRIPARMCSSFGPSCCHVCAPCCIL